MRSITLVVSAIILSLGLLGGGFFIGQTLTNNNQQTVDVRGLSQRRVMSDSVYWEVRYNVSRHGEAGRADLYSQSKRDQAIIQKFLRSAGFSDKEIKEPVVNYEKNEYRNNGVLVDVEHKLTGIIAIDSRDIAKVNTARREISQLVVRGVDVQSQTPQFYFTGLNAVKPEMVKESTHNARAAAQEVANYVGTRVGKIKRASQGSFVIKDVGNEYSDKQSIEKEVRLVTTVTFFLDND